MQKDVLQVEYAAEGGERQHQGPAREEHLGVPGDAVLGCAGSCKASTGVRVRDSSLSQPPPSPSPWVVLSRIALGSREEAASTAQPCCHPAQGTAPLALGAQMVSKAST